MIGNNTFTQKMVGSVRLGLLASLFILSGISDAWTQSLAFSRVINYNLASGTPQAFTVPAGKVWKVESAGLNYAGSSQLYLRSSAGVSISVLVWTNSSAQPFYNTAFPLWLEAAYAGQFYTAGSTGIVSIIEFTIVP